MSKDTQAIDKVEASPALAFEKERAKLLAQMTDATKEIAKDCDSRIDKANRGNTMTMYYIGSRMVDALDEAKQAEYGSNAAKQLATYIPFFDGDTNMLYALRRVAQTFDEAFIKENAERKIGKGQYISLQHWIELAKIAKAEDRNKTFDAIVTHGLSAAEIARRIRSGEVKAKNIRAGGRKVAPPTSLLSGLEKLRADSLKVVNYLKMCDTHVFGRIAKMAVTEFSDTLIAKMRADKEELAKLRTKIDEADKSLDACLERGEKALEEKAAKDKPQAAKAPPAKPAKKPQAAKPKVKAKRPGAATAAV